MEDEFEEVTKTFGMPDKLISDNRKKLARRRSSVGLEIEKKEV